jgi:hypothetical protein
MQCQSGDRHGAGRRCLYVVGCALIVWACTGPGCDLGGGIDKPIDQALLDARIAAAEDALRAADGHDYSAITGLLEEYYGDAAVTTYICTQFIDAPHCFRITAVSIRGEDTDPPWRERFCDLEREAWESSPWGSQADPEQSTQTAVECYQECMAGLPFLIR